MKTVKAMLPLLRLSFAALRHRITKMSNIYPNDADGDALRRVAADGSDMSRPMFVDFQIAVPDEASAKGVADAAAKLGYHAKVYDSPGISLEWTCECSTRILATYETVLAIQEELAGLSAPFGGHPDGWGTFGNGPNSLRS